MQADKSDTHAEIHAQDVAGLPMGGYRNYEGLVNLIPGAMPTITQNSITDTPGRALSSRHSAAVAAWRMPTA